VESCPFEADAAGTATWVKRQAGQPLTARARKSGDGIVVLDKMEGQRAGGTRRDAQAVAGRGNFEGSVCKASLGDVAADEACLHTVHDL
jgi:hypothetical protein